MNLLRVDFDFGDLATTETAELLGATLRAEFSFPMVGPTGATGPMGPQGPDGSVSGTLAWTNITGKPVTFPPSTHTHVAADVTDFASAVAAVSPPVDWNSLTGKPSTFAPSAHTHSTSDIVNFGTAAAAAAPVQSVAGRVGNVVLAKGDVGLGNVDNTSDANKPVSASMQAALDGKAATVHGHSIGDISGLQTSLDGKQASGSYATLVNGTVPSNQLPSFVDDVLEYANLAAFPATGESGKIFVAIDTRKTYRWSGSAYVEIGSSEVTSVAGRTGAVTLAVSDVSGAVANNDARLTDARNPLSHSSTHHTGGTDAIAPNQISAQWAQVISNQTITGNTLLSAGRNRRITLTTVGVSANVDLPHENNQAGDIVTLRAVVVSSGVLTIRTATSMSGGTPSAYGVLGTLSATSQSLTFVSNGTATGWSLVAVDTHTHPSTQITGLATVATTGDYDDLTDKPSIPTASSATPQALGVAAAGTSANFARADHVHAMPSANDLGLGSDDGVTFNGVTVATEESGVFIATSGIEFIGDAAANTRNDLGLGTAATADSTDFAAATHAASHAASGSDPVLPQSIGAQSIFVTEDLGTITASTTLTASRAKIWLINTNTSGLHVELPTTNIVAGDVAQIRFTTQTGQTLQLRRGGNIFGTSLSNGQQATFIAASTSSTSWAEAPNNRFAVGSSSGVPIITGSGGYIGAGSFGASAGQFSEGNHAHGNLTSDGKLGSTAGLPVVTTTAGAMTTLALGTAGQVLTVNSGATGVEFAAASGGGGEVRFDTATVYTYTGLAAAGSSESSAVWFIRRSEFSSAGAYVSTTTANNVQWANRLTASYT